MSHPKVAFTCWMLAVAIAGAALSGPPCSAAVEHVAAHTLLAVVLSAGLGARLERTIVLYKTTKEKG